MCFDEYLNESIIAGQRSRGTADRYISGYLAKYNSPALIGGKSGFTETLKPGCFDKTLASGADIVCCFDHATTRLLGRLASGSLELESDKIGLFFRCKLPADVSYAADVFSLVESGNLRGCSFAGIFSADHWSDDWKRREVTQIDLIEGGPVSLPAYLSTSVQTGRRSALEGQADELIETGHRRAQLDKIEADHLGAQADRLVADALIAENRSLTERADGSRSESVELRDLLRRFGCASIQDLNHRATTDAECRTALLALSVRADASLKQEARR